jgi:hypothetical protein
MVTPVETSDKQHAQAGRCDALARAKGLTPKHFSFNRIPYRSSGAKEQYLFHWNGTGNACSRKTVTSIE